MIVYMRVSKDRYELPLAIADTIKELAIICGVSPNLISSCISQSKRKGYSSEYKKVIISEEADP